MRAYLTQRQYEYGDSINLATIRELLAEENIKIVNDSLFQLHFERAIETLRDMDATKENLILPWIDREEIDSKQGIRSSVISVNPEPITWKAEMENIDDETKKEMKISYESSINCIRVLAVISERLNLEKDLKTMVQLHSKLANNMNINYTPTGIFHQDFSGIRNTYEDEGNSPELDPQTKLDLRRHDLIANDFWGHQARRKNGDMTVGDVIEAPNHQRSW